MNKVVLIGRLTKDPELRYLQDGSNKCYARFTLAVDRGLSKEKKEEAQAKGQQTADFINIVVWGKQAENCQKYLAKGKNVAIQGRIQTGSYTAQDGTKRYTTDVWAEGVQFIDWGEKKEQDNVQPFGQFDAPDMPFQDVDMDEDIPF